MVNEIFQTRWRDLKNQVRQHWNRLTEEDMSRLNGNPEDFVSVLRKRYGYGKAQAEIEINKWLSEVFEDVNKPL